MLKRSIKLILTPAILVVLAVAVSVQPADALPTLQLGASLDGGDTLVPYTFTSYYGSAMDKAAWVNNTNPFTLVLGGSFGQDSVSLGGGDYGGNLGLRLGVLLIASVPEYSVGTGTITINNKTLQPLIFTGNTKPTDFKDTSLSASKADFLVFDLGELGITQFVNNPEGVRDFTKPGDLSRMGNGQEILLSVEKSGFDWINFDVAAILGIRGIEGIGTPTDYTAYVDANNPNSLDVTAVPEPATVLLLGSGLLGFAAIGRRLRKRG